MSVCCLGVCWGGGGGEVTGVCGVGVCGGEVTGVCGVGVCGGEVTGVCVV